jgi:hypothetical protein
MAYTIRTISIGEKALARLVKDGNKKNRNLRESVDVLLDEWFEKHTSNYEIKCYDTFINRSVKIDASKWSRLQDIAKERNKPTNKMFSIAVEEWLVWHGLIKIEED